MVPKHHFFIRSLLASKSSIVCVGFSVLKQNFQLREHLLQLRLIVLHFTSYTAVYFNKCGSSLRINALVFQLSRMFLMNDCPPKPGLTLMIQTKSTSLITSSSKSILVWIDSDPSFHSFCFDGL
jgi:hypothetical protein